MTVVVEKLAGGVYYLEGGSTDSVAIEQADHAVVVEAPLTTHALQPSSRRSGRPSRTNDPLRRELPRPLRPLGWPARVRRRGCDSGDARDEPPYYEKAWAAPRTLNPGRQANATRPATFETFAEKHVLTDGRRSIKSIHSQATGTTMRSPW